MLGIITLVIGIIGALSGLTKLKSSVFRSFLGIGVSFAVLALLLHSLASQANADSAWGFILRFFVLIVLAVGAIVMVVRVPKLLGQVSSTNGTKSVHQRVKGDSGHETLDTFQHRSRAEQIVSLIIAVFSLLAAALTLVNAWLGND